MVTIYEYLKSLASLVSDDDLVVTNLGQTFEIWSILRPSDANFYRVNLGQVSAVACGLAIAIPERRIIAIDGDGNLLLNLSSLADIAYLKPRNLTIIVMDNGVYQSGGGMPTMTSRNVELSQVARGCGIEKSFTVRDVESFELRVREALKSDGLYFIVAKTEPGRPSLPYSMREDGHEIKYRFVRHIERITGKNIFSPGYEEKLYRRKSV